MINSYIDDKGYERLCDSGKLVHRLVIERKLGRKLKPWETVHHRNKNRLDNRPINLYVTRLTGAPIEYQVPGGIADYVLGI